MQKALFNILDRDLCMYTNYNRSVHVQKYSGFQNVTCSILYVLYIHTAQHIILELIRLD